MTAVKTTDWGCEQAKLAEKVMSMPLNSVRVGLVARETDWRWSSARSCGWGRTVGVPIRGRR